MKSKVNFFIIDSNILHDGVKIILCLVNFKIVFVKIKLKHHSLAAFVYLCYALHYSDSFHEFKFHLRLVLFVHRETFLIIWFPDFTI